MSTQNLKEKMPGRLTLQHMVGQAAQKLEAIRGIYKKVYDRFAKESVICRFRTM